MADELIDGVSMKLGRRTYVVPPLNFKALRNLRPQMELLNSIEVNATTIPDNVLTAIVQIVHTAIKRNYPDITIDEVDDAIDLGNQGSIIKAVMTGSGLVPSGEAIPGLKS
jgi:hypothetical protein